MAGIATGIFIFARLMSEKRLQKINQSTRISLALNGLMALAKIITGFFGNSLAVLTDGLDSLGDMISSSVMLYTTRIMKRPPDIRFSYGYKRAEPVAAKVISFFIFFAGAQIVFFAVKKIIAGQTNPLPADIAIAVTLLSILLKLFLSIHQKKTGKSLNSSMLLAYAQNMKNDVILSVGVLAGLFITKFTGMPLIDQIIGLLIGIYVMYTGFKIFIPSSIELMDGVEDPEVYQKTLRAINRIKGVHHPHRLRIRKIGDQYAIVVDVEIDGAINVLKATSLLEKVEESIKKDIPNVYDILVHMEPYGQSEKDEKFGISDENLPK